VKTLQIDLRSSLATFELDISIDTTARSIGLFGPSGAGKTTVLETIVGLRRPAAGRIVLGADTLFDSRASIDVEIHQRRVGYVPQEPTLFPHWTVERNLTATQRCDAAFLARLVEVLALGDLLGRAPMTLSGGEARRVALARALATRPRILVLDEPLAALDRPLRARVLSDLIRVRATFDVPLVLVSHDPTEIVAACDEVFVLEKGRIVARGAPNRVLRERSHPGEPYENVVAGWVRDVDGRTARIELDQGLVVFAIVEDAHVGERMWLGLDAEDVLIADAAPSRISARNVLPAEIVAIASDADGRTRVEARLGDATGAPTLVVDVTRSAANELALTEGRRIHLVFKAGSCRAVARGEAAIR